MEERKGKVKGRNGNVTWLTLSMRLLKILQRQKEGWHVIMIVNEGGKIRKEEGMKEERW